MDKLKSIMTQLASIDCKVDDDDAVAVLLKSMPEEYDSLITTLKNLPSPTLEGCISALLEEESKFQSLNLYLNRHLSSLIFQT